jgi:iron complex transport system substrate-binding protein
MNPKARIVVKWLVLVTLLLAVMPVGAIMSAPPQQGKTVVTDALGRAVEFAQPPQRIVAAGKAVRMTADALFLFPEARPRVVALEGRSQQVIDFLSLVNPNVGQVQFLERDAGPEQIAATRPDVVILKSYLADKLGKSVESLGIPVVYVDLETPDQVLRDVSTLGQLFGNLARAEEVLSFYQTRLDRVSQALQGLPEQEKPRVLLLQHTNQGGQVAFSVPPAQWIQTTMVELAGGAPVWPEAAPGGSWTVVNFEQIAAWNPDIILVVSYSADPGKLAADLKSEAQWQALKAVQGGRLYGFPTDLTGYSWDQPDTRWILGLTWMARRLHPDRLPDVDMRREVYDFFGQMYGMDTAAIDKSIVPVLRGDLD